MADTLGSLDVVQRALLDAWFPRARLVADLGWGQVPRVVLLLDVGDGERVVVKASGPGDRHVAVELEAHRRWVPPLATIGRAPRLLHGDSAARILATAFLPGDLVQGNPSQQQPDTFAQAGELLRIFHDSEQVCDEAFQAERRRATLGWLSSPHRIEPELARRVRRAVEDWPEGPVPVVPVHSDFQPRNWIVAAGQVNLIDFGGAQVGPAALDLTRLYRQDFERDERLERAFLEGYGRDPRLDDEQLWHRELVAQAVSTAAWAFQVGDEDFERQGHRMLAQAVAQGLVG